jgi:molybdenum cofactor synthesis domain-containing protein
MIEGKLLHVCISAKKGIAKHEVPSLSLRVEHGVEGDAHAGDWHRQVSLLAHTDIESMRAKGLSLKPGAFGENLVIDGLNTDSLGIGSRLRVGSALLELTQIGKVCHTRCAIYYSTGDCIMPRLGLFARVLEAGELHSGMPVQVVFQVPRSTIQAAVLTISDRFAAGTILDTAGPSVADLLQGKLNARIAWSRTVPDNVDQIADALKDLCDRRVDLLITAGGTGISPHNVTLEATRKVIDREVPGIAEAMRACTSAHTLNAMLSRAVAGVRQETLIINLPGSRKAAMEYLGAILPVLAHVVHMLRNQAAHPESDKDRLIALGEAESAPQPGPVIAVG